MTIRIGVDIGGTFTDVVVENEARRWSVKVPTTHAGPEDGVLEAVARGLAAAGCTLTEVDGLIHGTTLATNALIERKGAVTALLTTEGFRDVLEMGNEGRFDQYDLRVVKPVPLVPRRLRFTARERLRHDGSVRDPLDDGTVERAGAAMAAAGAEAVAVTFLHAYANPAHEVRARAILAGILGDVPISVSHEVSPEMREYERTSTTCANAYLQPVVGPYLRRLEQRLRDDGLRAPMLLILSSGSLTTVATAARFPIRLLESGPAGGALFAADIARRLDLGSVLSLDVGGTTAKFCLIDGFEPRYAHSFEFGRTYRFKKGSGLPVRVPVIDLVEIGAGGGSIARVDALARIAVGPDSAGSEPGPACYGRGGDLPAVTDCDLVLGKLDAATFSGGTMPLDEAAAGRVIARDIGAPSGLSTANAAYAVTEVITESMAAAAQVHAAEIGVDVETRTLIAFGGGAPLHAARFAEKLGIDEIVIPSGAGVGSAIGFLRAPLAFELVRTVRLTLPGGDPEPVRTALAEMEAAAAAIVNDAAVSPTLAIRRGAYMRYVGQGHEIEVAVGDHAAAGFADELHAAFTAAYMGLYGQAIAANPVEVTAWTVRVEAAREQSRDEVAEPRPRPAEPSGRRQVFDGAGGTWQDWPVYDRSSLASGAAGAGPAVIAEDETTTIVPPGIAFRIDGGGFIRLIRERRR